MELSAINKFFLLESYKQKEKFFTVLGLLFTRQVSLAKVAEILGMSKEEFSRMFNLIGLEYSDFAKHSRVRLGNYFICHLTHHITKLIPHFFIRQRV